MTQVRTGLTEKYEAIVAADSEAAMRELASKLTVKELRGIWEKYTPYAEVQRTTGLSKVRKADWVDTVVSLASMEVAKKAAAAAQSATAVEEDAETEQTVQLEYTVKDFRNKLAKLQEERMFVRICDLRRALNWPSDVFDGMLRELRDSMTINMAQADRSLLTDEEYANSFTDENGYVMGLISWDRWSEVEPCDDGGEHAAPADVEERAETVPTETVAPATEVEPAPANGKFAVGQTYRVNTWACYYRTWEVKNRTAKYVTFVDGFWVVRCKVREDETGREHAWVELNGRGNLLDALVEEAPAPAAASEAETVAPATEIKPAPAPAKLVSCHYDFSACKDEKKLRKVLNAAKVEQLAVIAHGVKGFKPRTDGKRMTKKYLIDAIVSATFHKEQVTPSLSAPVTPAEFVTEPARKPETKMDAAAEAVKAAATYPELHEELMTLTKARIKEVTSAITGNPADYPKSWSKSDVASRAAHRILFWRETEAYRARPYDERYEELFSLPYGKVCDRLRMMSRAELVETAHRLNPNRTINIRMTDEALRYYISRDVKLVVEANAIETLAADGESEEVEERLNRAGDPLLRLLVVRAGVNVRVPHGQYPRTWLRPVVTALMEYYG